MGLRERVPAVGRSIHGSCDGTYILHEEIVTVLFLDICLDNAAKHGSGGVSITCERGEGIISIDIANSVRTNEEIGHTHTSLSTGLGVQDLAELCSCRRLAFQNGFDEADGL